MPTGPHTLFARVSFHIVLLGMLFPCLSCAPPKIEVHERTDFVMGTVSELKVASDSEESAAAALQLAYETLQRIETLTTSYSEFSDVSRLNNAGGERVPLDDDTRRIFDLAFRIRDESDGAFTPALGALIRAWGFHEEPAVPSRSAIAAALKKEEYDLGGVAKGYGVDRAADALGRLGGCLVNVGGDLAVRGTRPDGMGWLIGVQDPRDPSQLFLKLRVRDEVAVATSGDYQRYFEVDGVRYHHILDPRTGWPAKGLRSATVIARTCVVADAWATAAFVLGAKEGLAMLEERDGLEGVLVEEDDQGRLLLHQTSGFGAYLETEP